jgi:phenylacetate-CoA ligase
VVNCWDKTNEFLSAEDIKDKQLALLNKSLGRAKNSEYYKKTFSGLKSFASLKELENIAFITKEDLRDNFPYGLVAVDKSELVRLHSSSGTTGTPTVVYYTKKDLDDWSELISRCMVMTGATKEDVFQNTMGHGLFTGGLGFHYGAEKVGMLTIPFGPGNSPRQIWFMKEFGVTVVHILPSYAMHLYSSFSELGMDPKEFKLKTAYIGAEPHSEEMRRQIEQLYGIKAYNSYGLSEMCGPGVAFECEYQNGMHIWEDHFYAEIIDPDTGKVLPDGEEGELVLTTLQKEAMPLFRYRTKDLTKFISEPCECGRFHKRIDRIKGRTDDMLILNGVNTFPIQIEKALMTVDGIGRNYKIEVHKRGYMDKLVVYAELTEESFTDNFKDLERLKSKVVDSLKSELLLTPEVHLVRPDSIEVLPGKVKRVFDMR